MDILWKKDVYSDSELYIDIFEIEGNPVDINRIRSSIRRHVVDDNAKMRSVEAALDDRSFGDAAYKKKQLFKAMHHYNTSLRLLLDFETAETASIYANRGTCFLEMNMPNECVTDLTFSIYSGYPPDRIQTRFAQCYRMLDNKQYKPTQFENREPVLSFEQHEQFTGVADCLKFETNSEFGRHVITTEDLKIGETILVENPFSIAPRNRGETDHCWNCFKEWANFIPCKNCHEPLYCDNNCLKKSFHEYDCGIVDSSVALYSGDLVRKMFFRITATFPDVDSLMFAVELLLTTERCEYISALTNPEHRMFSAIFQLPHHHIKKSNTQLTELRKATAYTFCVIMGIPEFSRKYASTKHQRFLQHLILHLYHIADNSFGLYEYARSHPGKLEPENFGLYAVALYPFACYIKHSCVPNVHWISIDGRLICNVIRPIKKGEQIFRTYNSNVLLNAPSSPFYLFTPSSIIYSNPNTRLEPIYHVKCKCLLCSNVELFPNFLALGKIQITKDQLYKDAIATASISVPDFRKLPKARIEHYERSAIAFLEKYSRFHPINSTIEVQNTLIIMWNMIAAPM